MPLLLKQELKRISKVVRLESALPSNDKDLLTWWYCGILKNRKDASQPIALVAFRTLLSSGNLSDEVTYRRVPITALGQVRIGTVWRDRLCQRELSLETSKFTVDFTKGNWKLTSFHQTLEEGSPPPYPHAVHPLMHRNDRNWLLEFTLPNGGKLIVPCLEFFTRCYGRSAELRRVLTTYSWEECQGKRLYAPIGEPEEPDKWKVKLRKRLTNGDVILLAHAKYDTYTKFAAKSIYSQIEANFNPDGKQLTFIQVAPWFQGPAVIIAKGTWFDERRSFLAHQIVGCSEPDGVPIHLNRENTNRTLQSGDSDKPGSAWNGAPERKRTRRPDIIDLTGEVPPDPEAISIEIEDPDFVVPGERRLVISVEKEQAQDSSGTRKKGREASSFSSGEAHGRGQGVGYASIHAPAVMESQGTLRDMWNAMQFLAKKRSDLIQSVEWFTFNVGYSQAAEPHLIGLHPFGDDADVNGKIRNWPYMDGPAEANARGILVARLKTPGKTIHILEIQRRTTVKTDDQGNTAETEESYKGLAFVAENKADVEEWLIRILSEVRYVCGVVDKLAGSCPGISATFNHRATAKDEVPCETTVMNALKKVGVDARSTKKACTSAGNDGGGLG